MSRRFRAALACVLALSLAVPAMASAMPAKKAGVSPKTLSAGVRTLAEPGNNDLAGSEALPAGPTAFGLNAATDTWDTYYVDLLAGQKLAVKVTAGSTTDYDVWLFAPGSTTVADLPVFASANEIYPESFTYVVTTPGRYYVAVQAAAGSGNYTLSSKVEASVADDEIPGVDLPASSPTTGTLDRYGDQDDVYKVILDQGETLQFALSGPSTADFDAFVFGPTATSVFVDDPLLASDGLTSSESGSFTAPTAGEYYLDIYAAFGSGAYTLTHDAGEASTISLAGPATIKYGGTATLTGSLLASDAVTPRTGEVVTLQKKAYGASSWSSVATASVDASGVFSFSQKPTIATSYRATFENEALDLLPVTSAVVLVKPGVSITVPAAPSVVGRGVSFTTGGFLKPRHPAGSHTVKIWAQRYERQSNGTYKWVTRRDFTTTNSNYSSYSRYRAVISIPSAGRWRLQARELTSSKYAFTKTAYRYFTVR